MVRTLLWASVAGCLASQAYLWHGAWALPATVALGVALASGQAHSSPRAATIAALTVFQTWVGVHCWGFAHYGAGLYAGSILYMAMSGLLVGGMVSIRRGGQPSPVALAAAWVLIEAVHEIGDVGFPLYLGATQVHLPWRALLAVVGAVGTSGLLVGLGVAIGQRRRSALVWLLAAVALTGLGRWQPDLTEAGPPVEVAAVQGAVPSWLYKAMDRSLPAGYLVEDHYFRLAQDALGTEADLVLMPESALHHPIAMRDGRAADPLFDPLEGTPATTQVITGAYREVWEGEELTLYNAALLLAADDAHTVLASADKRLLAPIVESPFTAGTGSGVLETGHARFGVLICYESMYPRLARSQSHEAEALLVLTNDAGFERAPVSVTHARQGWSRAVENGRPLVRVAQGGVSLALDHRGETLARLDLFERGILEATIQPMRGATWYNRGGVLLPWLCAALLLVRLLYSGRRGLAMRQQHAEQ